MNGNNNIDTMSTEFKKALKSFNMAEKLYAENEFCNAKKWFKAASDMFNDIYHEGLLLQYKHISDRDYIKLCDAMDTAIDYIKECRKLIVKCDSFLCSGKSF